LTENFSKILGKASTIDYKLSTTDY